MYMLHILANNPICTHVTVLRTVMCSARSMPATVLNNWRYKFDVLPASAKCLRQRDFVSCNGSKQVRGYKLKGHFIFLLKTARNVDRDSVSLFQGTLLKVFFSNLCFARSWNFCNAWWMCGCQLFPSLSLSLVQIQKKNE